MPLRHKVVNALRYLKQNPRVSERGIKFIANKLQEDPEEAQKYLRLARRHLVKGEHYPLDHPMVRNINRLSRQVR